MHPHYACRAACEATCRALADVSRQSDLLWQVSELPVSASQDGYAALLAWLAAHQLQHLRLAYGRPLHQLWGEQLAAVLARMPRLASLEVPADLGYALAATQLSFLSLTTAVDDSAAEWLWHVPPQLGQLAGLRTLRLNGRLDGHVIWELNRSIPAGLHTFAADNAELTGVAALSAAARSLRRLELGGCNSGDTGECAALRRVLRQATGLTHLALESVFAKLPSSDSLTGLLQDVGALATLRVLRLEGVSSWPGAGREGVRGLGCRQLPADAACLRGVCSELAHAPVAPAESTAASMSSLTALSLGYGMRHELLRRLPPAAALHTLLLACGDPSASVDWPGFGQALRQVRTLVLPINELRHLVQHPPDGQPSQPSQRLPSVQRLVLLNGAYTLGSGQRAPTAAQLRDGCQLLPALPASLPALRELVFRPQVLDAVTAARESGAHLAALLAGAPHLRVSTTSCPSAWQLAAGAAPCPCCL